MDIIPRKELYFDDIELEFKKNLQIFITGETLYLKKGKLIIGKNCIRNGS
jgi:hypothetical protein